MTGPDGDAQEGFPDPRLEALDEAGHDLDADGEPEILGLAKDCRVDPDHLTFPVQQRAARVSGVDGGICLDQAFEDTGLRTQRPAHGGDDPRRDGGLGQVEPEGVADGDGRVTHLDALRFSQSQRLEALGVHHEQCQITGPRRGDDCGVPLSPVWRHHDHRGGTLDHVGVGEDEAVFDDDPRTGARRHLSGIAEYVELHLFLDHRDDAPGDHLRELGDVIEVGGDAFDSASGADVVGVADSVAVAWRGASARSFVQATATRSAMSSAASASRI